MTQSNVTPLPRVEISDLARSILALETDRQCLQSKLVEVSKAKEAILLKAVQDINNLEASVEAVHYRISALDDALFKLLHSKVL